jgi:hypothetical protein
MTSSSFSGMTETAVVPTPLAPTGATREEPSHPGRAWLLTPGR